MIHHTCPVVRPKKKNPQLNRRAVPPRFGPWGTPLPGSTLPPCAEGGVLLSLSRRRGAITIAGVENPRWDKFPVLLPWSDGVSFRSGGEARMDIAAWRECMDPETMLHPYLRMTAS